MTVQADDARARFLARIEFYRSLGFDRPAAVRFVVEQLGQFENPVLDVGTGQGQLAIALAKAGAAVTSIDANAEEQAVGIANARGDGLAEQITFLTVDARDLPCADGAFGAVAMMDALHHLDDGPAVFSQMRRVLRSGGRLLLAEFTPAGFALVAKAHEAEGRTHPVGPVAFSSAVSWFQDHQCSLSVLTEGHLHDVAVLVAR